MDTTFWGKLSRAPKNFNEKYRARVKLFEYDFLVMPMFEWYVVVFFMHSPLIFSSLLQESLETGNCREPWGLYQWKCVRDSFSNIYACCLLFQYVTHSRFPWNEKPFQGRDGKASKDF